MGAIKKYPNLTGQIGRLHVKPGSAFSEKNGWLFQIVEAIGSRISLDINGQTTDFYKNEVSINTTSLGWIGYGLCQSWGLI